MNESYKEKVRQNVIKKFSAQKYRNILVAYKDFAGNVNSTPDDVLNKNLVFLTIAGIQDPLRKEVPGAI